MSSDHNIRGILFVDLFRVRFTKFLVKQKNASGDLCDFSSADRLIFILRGIPGNCVKSGFISWQSVVCGVGKARSEK